MQMQKSKVGGTTFYDVDGMTFHHLLITNIHANPTEVTKRQKFNEIWTCTHHLLHPLESLQMG